VHASAANRTPRSSPNQTQNTNLSAAFTFIAGIFSQRKQEETRTGSKSHPRFKQKNIFSHLGLRIFSLLHALLNRKIFIITLVTRKTTTLAEPTLMG